jgi:hypothetical protein
MYFCSGLYGRQIDITVGGDIPLFYFLGFSYSTRTLCRYEQTYYIVWHLDMDWMHLEVGLKRACWFYSEI